jgi:Undecaprenyl-phosphate glucose phosphotransferase
MLKKHSHFWGSILLLTDILIIALAWLSAYYLRFSGSWDLIHFKNYLIILLPILLVWPFIFKHMGIYRQRRVSPSPFAEISDISKASTLAVLILIASSFLVKKHELSRLVFFYFWSLSIIMLSLERLAFRGLLRYFRQKGYNTRSVLIVGAGELGARIAMKIKENPWTGLVAVGYLDDYKPMGREIEGEKVLGRISDIEDVIDKKIVDQVFIALPVRAYKRLLYVVEKLSDKMVSVRIVPDIYQAVTLNAGAEDFEGFPLINITDSPMYGWDVVVKRAADILFSLLALLILSPIMAVISIGIKLTSPGPVIFKQKRYGLDGKEIKVYKFRSMTVCEDGADIPQAKRCDPRITPFGAFLRKTSLDELPQFINVLQGRMSIVGPRPHAVAHNEQYRKQIRSYMLRHKVKPGITGWAQVNGWRGETDTLDKMENRVRYDLFYIENWSLWFDIKIMWLTVWKGLVHRNAY